jgi:hypothetical protein
MKWIILGIGVSILCVVLLVRRGVKGPARTIETIKQPIKDLLQRGFDGGFLIIDVSSSKYFLQLRKYINEPGDYGIELSFPIAKWSLNLSDKLTEFCNRCGIAYNLEKDENKGSLDFLYIDFGKDYKKAHEYVSRILLEVFDINPDAKLFVRLENATVEDKLIDR